MKFKKVISFILRYGLVAAVGFLIGVGMVTHDITQERNKRAKIQGELWRRAAPPIDAKTVGGARWQLADQKGKVVLVDFWATWCPGCKDSTERLKALYDEFGGREDFAMIGVSLDDSVQTVQKFCEANGVKWAQVVEPNAKWDNTIVKNYGVSAVPCVRIVDRRGVLQVIDGDVVDIGWVIKELLDNPNAIGYTRLGK